MQLPHWLDYWFDVLGVHRLLDFLIFTLTPFLVILHLGLRHFPLAFFSNEKLAAAPSIQVSTPSLDPALVPVPAGELPAILGDSGPPGLIGQTDVFPTGFPWSDIGYATILALIVGAVLFRIIPECLKFLKEEREDYTKTIIELKRQNIEAEQKREAFFEARLRELITHHESQMKMLLDSSHSSIATIHADMKELIQAVHNPRGN